MFSQEANISSPNIYVFYTCTAQRILMRLHFSGSIGKIVEHPGALGGAGETIYKASG